MSPVPKPQSAEAFKRDDAASYDAVADRFEKYTGRFTAPIARALVESAHLAPDAHVLDVGCGTGILSRIAATSRASTGRVIGVDLSDGMLEQAAALARAEGVGERIEFRKGDAEHLAFPDASFDAVVSLYALRHFPDPMQSLREIVRVGRPGSKAAIGVGSAPPWWSAGFLVGGCRAVFERMQGLTGHRPLYATRFLDQLLAKHVTPQTHLHGTADAVGDLARAMRGVGYRDVRATWVGQSSMIASAEDFWGVQVTLSTQARKALPTMKGKAVAALRREFDDICATQLRRGGKLVYRSGALIVSGSRPG